jgi:hypothetical protein
VPHAFFRERDCITIVRQAEDENTLLETLRPPEFRDAIGRLKHEVFAATRPKAVNDRALSGAMLSTLAMTHAQALNSGSAPTISTAWDRVLQSQAAEAMGRALAECVASRRASPSLGVVLRRCARRQPPPPSLRARCCCNRSVWGLRSGLARPARRDAADQR